MLTLPLVLLGLLLIFSRAEALARPRGARTAAEDHSVPAENDFLGDGRSSRRLLQDVFCLADLYDPDTLISAFTNAHELTCGGQGCPNQPKWSVHKCTGNFVRNRACRFKNLYYNIKENKWEYYVCPDAPPRSVVYTHDNSFEDFASTKSSKDHHMDKVFLYTGRYGDTITIEKVRGMPPDGRKVHDWKKMAVFWSGNKPGAFGHYWVDNAYPIYMMLSNFGVERFWDYDLIVDLKKLAYKKVLDRYFNGTMSSNEIVMWPWVTKEFDAEYIRFPDIIAGNGRYALTIVSDNRDEVARPNYSLSTMWWGMRNMIYEGAGLNPAVVPHKHKVLINLSLIRRSVDNPVETEQCLRQAFPHLDISAVMFRDYTWQEQLAVLQQTTIYIANEGSSGFRQVFLPKGAMMIILSTPMKDWARETRYSPFHEADRWFEFLSYVNFLRYPVNATNTDEYVMRSDRLKNDEKRQDERELYNLYDADIVIKCERIIPLVRQALIEYSLQQVYGAHAPVSGGRSM